MWSINRLLSFDVIDLPQIVSDHCMLSYKVSANAPNVEHIITGRSRYVWNRSFCDKYVERLSHVQAALEVVAETLCNTNNEDVIATGISEYTQSAVFEKISC